MLSRLKPEAECGALRKWLRQYHFGVVGGNVNGEGILTFRPILVDDFTHSKESKNKFTGLVTLVTHVITPSHPLPLM
jgi:hypothetical protein